MIEWLDTNFLNQLDVRSIKIWGVKLYDYLWFAKNDVLKMLRMRVWKEVFENDCLKRSVRKESVWNEVFEKKLKGVFENKFFVKEDWKEVFRMKCRKGNFRKKSDNIFFVFIPWPAQRSLWATPTDNSKHFPERLIRGNNI